MMLTKLLCRLGLHRYKITREGKYTLDLKCDWCGVECFYIGATGETRTNDENDV
jgi:hypothetical protein